MWGNLAKNAQALASIAAEQAQKGLASANQLLEKLDGQMDGEGDDEDDDDDDEESLNEDGSRREKRRANEESKKSQMVDNDATKDQEINDAASESGVSDRKVERFTSSKQSTTVEAMLEFNQQLAVEHVDNSIDDELDQLLLDDEAEDAAVDAAEHSNNLPSDSKGVVTSRLINSDSSISSSDPVDIAHSSKPVATHTASSNTEKDALNSEIKRLSNLLSNSKEQSAMITTELQTALEAALEAKSVAVQKLKEAKLHSKNEIDNLRTQAEQALKASELQAVELKEKHEKELMLQLQKQEIAISDSFRARIESMEIALQDSSAEAADCARGELAATEQLAILTKQLDRLKGESEAASNTNITNENLERTIQELSTTLENNDVTAKRSLDALNEELCAMRSAEKEARETCVTLSDDLVKLQSVVRNIEEEMLVSEKEAAQQAVSDSKIDALTREKASLLAELQQLQAEVAARDETDTEASEQRELSLAISTALFNEKEMQMAAAIADKNLFEEKLASMAEELEALRVSTLDTVRAETPPAVDEEGLEERYHSIVLQRDSLIARCSSLEDELNDLQSTANDTSVLSVGIEVQGLRDQLKEAEERLKEADSQVAVKDELLQLRENDVELMDNERTKSEEQISSLQKELKALKTQLATQLESSTETAERAVTDNKVVGELEVKVEGGQPSSEGSPVVRKDELENIVATQVSEISALLSAVEELETKCSTSAADLTQLTEEINASVTVVLERDATVESLKAENIALKKALRETTALLESERSTVAESEDSIFNLQAECSSAQQKVLLLEKSLETAVDSKINADIVLQKSIEDAEAARIFAENLLEQSIGDDDTRAGAELALKANMEIAEKQYKSLEAALRTELQEAIEEKMRSESELEEAFNAKTAGEQMLKDLLREATEGQKTAESALSDALKATAKLEEKLAKSKETLKREKELFSSSESRIEEVEAAAEKEIAVQLLRQEGIIAATFKGRIEDLEAIVQKSETMLEIALMDAAEKEKGELEARLELTHLRDQLALVQSDLERAETSRKEAEEAAEGHRENSDSVRAEIEAKYRATMEAADEQFKSLENDLTNDLRDALNAKINAEIDLEKALSEKAQVEAALRICEEDLKLTDKEANDAEARLISQNRTLTELEDSIQERVVENASLREELKRANALYQGLEVTYLQSGQALSNVRADLEAALAERESASLSAKQQIDTAIEEIEFHKSSSRAAEARLEDLSATHAAAEKTIAEMKAREKDYIEKLSVAQDAGMRVAEAEEALSRVEDKKKRDLENLKKQNERISAVQRELADKERVAMETISDLKAQLEASAAAASIQDSSLYALQAEVTACNQKIIALENALGTEGPGSGLEVKIPKGDDENSSDSSGDSSGGSSSFVVIGGDGDRGRPSRDPLLSAQASLVSELQDRHKDATAEIQSLKEQLMEQKTLNMNMSMSIASQPVVDTGSKEITAEQPPTAGMDDITKLQNELKHITGLYERSETRVASLEEERARLEAEAKELERSISRSIHEPSSSTSVHRQRPDRTIDIEAGLGHYRELEEEAKKGEAGFHPIVAHLWTIVRSTCPAALQFIGEKPPRLGVIGQVALGYFLFLHVLLWWFSTYKCPAL